MTRLLLAATFTDEELRTIIDALHSFNEHLWYSDSEDAKMRAIHFQRIQTNSELVGKIDAMLALKEKPAVTWKEPKP